MSTNKEEIERKKHHLRKMDPAFPVKYILGDGEFVSHGLSKREWFAGMALIGLAEKIKLSDEIIARYSVNVADAIIAELKKQKE